MLFVLFAGPLAMRVADSRLTIRESLQPRYRSAVFNIMYLFKRSAHSADSAPYFVSLHLKKDEEMEGEEEKHNLRGGARVRCLSLIFNDFQ